MQSTGFFTNTMVLMTIIGAIAGCRADPQPVDLLITDVTIYSGADPVPAAGSVVVHDGRFMAIGTIDDQAYVAATTIDGSGLFMIPGLWDAHAHLRSSTDSGIEPREFLDYGVTSIRDLGSVPERAMALQADMEVEGSRAPTIYASFSTLNGEVFGPHQRAVTTEEEVAAAISELASSGASIIKIHRATQPELLPVIVSEAHRHGLKVTGHIPLGMHPLEACKAGLNGVEHAGSFVEALVSVSEETGWAAQQSAARWLLSAEADPLYACLAQRSVAVTPTLTIYPRIAKRRAAGGEMRPEFVETIDMLKQLTMRLHRAGVPLLTGTDVSDLSDPVAVRPGESLHEELAMLEQAGMAPGDLVEMASLAVAQSVDADSESGSIEVGKVADFVLLAADPGAAASNFRNIVSVFRSGENVAGNP